MGDFASQGKRAMRNIENIEISCQEGSLRMLLAMSKARKSRVRGTWTFDFEKLEQRVKMLKASSRKRTERSDG